MADESTPIPISRAEYAARFGPSVPDGTTDLGTIGLSPEPDLPIDMPSIGSDAAPSAIPISRADYAAKFGISGQSPALNQIGKGLTLGWFNELQAADSAAQNSIASLFGYGNHKTFGENYAEKRDALAAVDTAYEKENPKTALALNLAGGLAPAVLSGGAGLLAGGAAKVAPSALSTLARNVFGVGLKESPTIPQLMKMGLTSGAITGAGEAQPGERLQGGIVGAGVGAIAAPVVGKTIEKGTNVLADLLARIKPIGAATMASERGAFTLGGDKLSPYSPAELMLAKQLKNVPLDKIRDASTQMDSAINTNTPLFLPEALGSAKVNRNARMVANHPTSMDFSQDAIGQRAAGAADRMTNLFDTISSERNVFQGASGMATAADNILDDATKAKLIATKPLYDAAKEANPVIESPAVTNLIEKDGYLQQAIAEVKKSAEYADKPDNALEVLIASKAKLRDIADSARRAGEGDKSRVVRNVLETVNKELEKESPAYGIANAKYAELSKGTSELEESKLSFLAALHPDKIDNVGQIFNMQPERITALRDSFVKAGHEEDFNAGIRSYLQNIVDKSKDGSNLIKKMIETPRQRELLKAALGDNFDKIINPLLTEQKIFAGKSAYFTGSSTQGNQAEAAEFEKGVGIIASVIKGNKLEALKKLFTGDLPDGVAQGLAEIYFNPGKGGETLKRVLPLVEQYARNKWGAGVAGKGAGIVAARANPPKTKQPAQKPKANLLERVTQGKVIDSPSLKPISLDSTNQDYSFMNTLFKGGDMYKGKPVSQVIDAVKSDPTDHAIALLESGMDPKAKNPESSATGLFQLIKGTAKNLGVDPTDPGDNYDGYLKLKEQTKKAFGSDDVATVYASHYLGIPTMRKWLNGEKLTDTQRGQVNYLKATLLPRLRRIYSGLTDSTTIEA